MNSDTPLKVAFRVRTKDLLPPTGDAGARLVSALTYELPAGRRTVDLVCDCEGMARSLARNASLRLVAEASRKIQREAPEAQWPDLLGISQC